MGTLIFQAICVFLLFFTSICILSLYNRKLKLDELKFISEFKYKTDADDISDFLNSFIIECMQDYILYNIVPDTGLDYINKERETKIRNDIRDLVVSRMSELLMKKISLCYSRKYIELILAEKIFSAVTVYVAEFNKGSNKIVDINKKRYKRIMQNKTDDEDITNNDW